jgi:hypothetical protein
MSSRCRVWLADSGGPRRRVRVIIHAGLHQQGHEAQKTESAVL